MRIKLVGTSHIAEQSVAEVRKVILEGEPDIVCVELDINRFRNLMQSKPNRLSLRDLRQFGSFGFLFAMVGQWIQKKLGDRVGINPGADMKEAVLAARKVGAQVYLVDQPIQKTLYNLSREVSSWEKTRLVFYLIFSPLYKENREIVKKIDLNRVPSEEVIEELICSLRKKFPNIYKVLVEDRNRYIAKTIALTQKHNDDKKIVAVVGAGHIRGVRNLLSKNVF